MCLPCGRSWPHITSHHCILMITLPSHCTRAHTIVIVAVLYLMMWTAPGLTSCLSSQLCSLLLCRETNSTAQRRFRERQKVLLCLAVCFLCKHSSAICPSCLCRALPCTLHMSQG